MRAFLQLTRFDKPIGIWLLFFPAGWAVALAAQPYDIPYYLGLMLAGAAVTRAAGCIMNDLTDRKLDVQVERTRSRPLASGAITPVQAWIVLAAFLVMALMIALSLPRTIWALVVIALPMIAAYPWMKRLTWWPQLFLGFTFNMSALFGWIAVGAPPVPVTYVLYAAGIFWTLGYDTIYAVQDMADDAKVGIRSSARALGGKLEKFTFVCYAAVIALLATVGVLTHAGWLYYLGLLGASVHAQWQLKQLPVAPEKAGALFRSNQWLGLIVLLGILADRVLGAMVFQLP